ncbi:hypothetical protein [Photobacterium sp. TY1-4]|nr:hypothetical protein [Photobacterium sp. TY1-4]
MRQQGKVIYQKTHPLMENTGKNLKSGENKKPLKQGLGKNKLA